MDFHILLMLFFVQRDHLSNGFDSKASGIIAKAVSCNFFLVTFDLENFTCGTQILIQKKSN